MLGNSDHPMTAQVREERDPPLRRAQESVNIDPTAALPEVICVAGGLVSHRHIIEDQYGYSYERPLRHRDEGTRYLRMLG